MGSSIFAIMAVHNRKEKTLNSLKKLFQSVPNNVTLNVVVLDDGSSDGTGQAIALLFPEIKILQGNGDAFWNGGMRTAWKAASETNPDFYLWINDDTLLDDGAIEKMLRTSNLFADRAIIIGSTYDSSSNEITYGGVRRKNLLRPLHFSLVKPNDDPQKVDTMNGNCVLIPKFVFERTGSLNSKFTHGMGDFDYGLRANKKGIETWIVPGTVGACSRNDPKNTWQDRSLPRKARLKKLRSVKGLPIKEWLYFTYQHGGRLWPVYFLSPYMRTILVGRMGEKK